jgi:hypothetical protein
MDEVAQADFRTDAEREECGGVLLRAEVMRAAFLLVEETTAGKHCREIRESAHGGVPGQRTGRLADRSPAAERPEPVGGGGGSRVIGLPSLQAIDRAQGARI